MKPGGKVSSASSTPPAKKLQASPVPAAPSLNKPSNYKTRLCDHWQLRGRCARGSSCLFAHGEHELRVLPVRPMTYELCVCWPISSQLRPRNQFNGFNTCSPNPFRPLRPAVLQVETTTADTRGRCTRWYCAGIMREMADVRGVRAVCTPMVRGN